MNTEIDNPDEPGALESMDEVEVIFKPSTEYPSDEILVEGLKSYNETALKIIRQKYDPRLKTVIVRKSASPNDVDDILQEIWLSIIDQIKSYDSSKGKFAGWLFTIAKRKSIDYLRRNMAYKRAVERNSEGVMIDGPQPICNDGQDTVINNELYHNLYQALSKIPIEQKEALELMMIGYSQRQIVGKLNVPLGTVKTRITLGLKKLKRALAGTVRVNDSPNEDLNRLGTTHHPKVRLYPTEKTFKDEMPPTRFKSLKDIVWKRSDPKKMMIFTPEPTKPKRVKQVRQPKIRIRKESLPSQRRKSMQESKADRYNIEPAWLLDISSKESELASTSESLLEVRGILLKPELIERLKNSTEEDVLHFEESDSAFATYFEAEFNALLSKLESKAKIELPADPVKIRGRPRKTPRLFKTHSESIKTRDADKSDVQMVGRYVKVPANSRWFSELSGLTK